MTSSQWDTDSLSNPKYPYSIDIEQTGEDVDEYHPMHESGQEGEMAWQQPHRQPPFVSVGRFLEASRRAMSNMRHRLPGASIQIIETKEVTYSAPRPRSPVRPPHRTASNKRSNRVLLTLLTVILFTLFYLFLRTPTMTTTPPSWADPRLYRSPAHRAQNFSSLNITPLPCLSHNDESRPIPLFTGLASGCSAVEADIWLYKGELLVGHDAPTLNTADKLSRLYLDPLLQILEGQTAQPSVRGRVYDQQPTREPFVLMLDFKSQGADTLATLHALSAALEPLRAANHLSYYDPTQGKRIDRGLLIVASGDVPFSALTSPGHSPARDIFFDAPLRWIWETEADLPQLGRQPGRGQGRAGCENVTDASVFDESNSYFASTSFKKMYWPPLFGLPEGVKREMGEQVKAAKAKGLKVRYWGTWDEVLSARARRRVWRELGELGVDVWNVDDIEGFARGDWRTEGEGR